MTIQRFPHSRTWRPFVLLAASLMILALAVACDQPEPPAPAEIEPEAPRDTGLGRLEETPSCGTLEMEIVRSEDEEPTVAGGGLGLTIRCRETDPGSCGAGGCIPCWQRRGSLTVLSCVCKRLCNVPTFFDPPTPEDFEMRGERPPVEP